MNCFQKIIILNLYFTPTFLNINHYKKNKRNLQKKYLL